ncbi:unnamed protein product [Laminaria digitata]
MEAAGKQIATLSDAETDRIKALGEEVIAEWIAEKAEKGLPAAALVEDARAMVAAAQADGS